MMAILGLLGCRDAMYPKVSAPDREPAAEYEALLAEVVTDEGLVDYDRLEENRLPLDRYVAWLAGKNPLRGKATGDHHATWLNAYNALVLFQVLERGRPASVRDVEGVLPFAGSGFFYETAFRVEDNWVSLGEIRDERLRMMELDLRDHAAMTCAARSCPPLRRELYRRAELESQLRTQMRNWVGDEARGVRIEGKEAVFNPIFDWYARDFEFFSAGKDLCEISSNYVERSLAQELLDLSARGCPHRFSDFDWSLNDASKGGG